MNRAYRTRASSTISRCSGCIRLLTVAALLLTGSLRAYAWSLDLPVPGKSGDGDYVILEVVEPFIEMHTGPGRGYPVFNVVEEGESIEIIMRRTNWYQIRTTDDKTGWASADKLARTLKPTGVPVDLPEVGRGDYLATSWRIGFTAGKFEDANSFSLTAGYRPLSWLGMEIEGGMIFDNSVTSDHVGLNLIFEPAPDWRVSPYVTAGGGIFSFDSRHKVIVSDTGSRDYGSLGVGVGYYLGRNFVLRGEYRSYSVSSNQDRVWVNAWKIGLNSFF